MKRLKELREEKGLAQKEVADFLNIHVNSYGRYEQGTREADYNTLIKLSKYFNVSIDYLLGNEIESKRLTINIANELNEIMNIVEKINNKINAQSAINDNQKVFDIDSIK